MSLPKTPAVWNLDDRNRRRHSQERQIVLKIVNPHAPESLGCYRPMRALPSIRRDSYQDPVPLMEYCRWARGTRSGAS
jgi:hypothetical protein